MNRKLISLVSVVAVALGLLVALAGTASAQQSRHDFGGGPLPFFSQTVVKGTVTAVDATADKFTATVTDVDAVPGHHFGFGHPFFHGFGRFFGGGSQGGFGDSGRGGLLRSRHHGGFGWKPPTIPTPTTTKPTTTTPTTTTPTTPAPTPLPATETITVNSSTHFDINGNLDATIADLTAGAKFVAVFAGSRNESLSAVLATPALEVAAFSPPQLYAFVGTVTAADTTAGTVTVNVTSSLPSGEFTGSQTFKVGPQTLVFGGTSTSLTGSLSNVTVGDVVSGGEISAAGQTAAAVEANPLKVLVDFSSAMTPPSSSSSSSSTTTPTATAMFKQLKSASFNKAVKKLEKRHRAAHHSAHRKAHHKAHRKAHQHKAHRASHRAGRR